MNSKTHFDFDRFPPPALTEAALLAERERRRLRRHTALLAVTALLTQTGLFLLSAALLWAGETVLAAGCFAYAAACTVGGGLLAAVFERKKEVFSL